MKKKIRLYVSNFEDQNFNFSAFDDKRKFLCVYNPLNCHMELFNCAEEIIKFIPKIHLIDNKASEYLERSSTIKLIYSERKSLMLMEKNITQLRDVEGSECDQDFFKPIIIYKQGQENDKLVNSWKTSALFDTFYLNHNKETLFQLFVEDEEISVRTLIKIKGIFHMAVATNKGKLFCFPLLFKLEEATLIY